MGFEELKHMYEDDLDFVVAWKASREPIVIERSKWLYYFIWDENLFKGSQLFISKSSLRENLINDKYINKLARHIGIGKTVALVSENYF